MIRAPGGMIDGRDASQTAFSARARSFLDRVRVYILLVSTAMPRVGVERPNGSYVARTFNRVGRVRLSRADRATTPPVRVAEGKLRFSLPAQLVHRSESSKRAIAHDDVFHLDVLASRNRSSVREDCAA